MNEETQTDPTVLVVEDETDLADLYAAWLEEQYPVRVANDGEEALEKLDPSVDIVLLDRRMPGLSGDEVLERIRSKSTVSCKVAMVTAVEPDFDIIDMGFDDYIVKPTTREDIFETVEGLTTRTEYDSKLDEYITLVSKKSALETEKTDAELEDNEEFNELEERIAELEDEVDPMVEQFDEADVAAMFRDLPSEV